MHPSGQRIVHLYKGLAPKGIISFVRLTKQFDRTTFEQALDSWAWLELDGKIPLLASLFGDVIMQDPTGYWFLDTVEGSLTRTWASQQEVQAALDTADGQDQYLLGGLAVASAETGLVLAESEVYSFKVPPVLGGGFDLVNVGLIEALVLPTLRGRWRCQA